MKTLEMWKKFQDSSLVSKITLGLVIALVLTQVIVNIRSYSSLLVLGVLSVVFFICVYLKIKLSTTHLVLVKRFLIVLSVVAVISRILQVGLAESISFLDDYYIIVSFITLLTIFYYEEEITEAYRLNIKLSRTSILLVLLIVSGIVFIIRAYPASYQQPTNDELYHLVTAKSLNSGDSGLYMMDGKVRKYTRSEFVSQQVYVGYKLFGESLLSARLFSIIFAVLTIPVMYYLGSKVSRFTGLMAALIFGLSPWFIEVGTLVREYSTYIFFYVLILIHVTAVSKIFIEGFSEKKVWKITVAIFLSLLSAIPLYYAFLINELSTFYMSLFIYLGGLSYLGVWSLFKFKIINLFYRHKIFTLLVGFVIFSVGLLVAGSLVPDNVYYINIVPAPDFGWVKYLLGNNGYLFINNIGISLILILLGSFTLFKVNAKKSLVNFNFGHMLLVILVLNLYFFTFHLNRSTEPRYLLSLTPIICILMSTGLETSVKLLKKYNIKTILVVALVVLCLNVSVLRMTIKPTDAGESAVTNNFREDFLAVTESPVYQQIIKNNELLITTNPTHVIYMAGEDFIKHNKVYYHSYTSDDRLEKLVNIVKDNPQGWIMFGRNRNYGSINLRAGNLALDEGPDICFEGRYANFYFYSWGMDKSCTVNLSETGSNWVYNLGEIIEY